MKKKIKQGIALIVVGKLIAIVTGVFSEGYVPAGFTTGGLFYSVVKGYMKFAGIQYRYILVLCAIIILLGIVRMFLKSKTS